MLSLEKFREIAEFGIADLIQESRTIFTTVFSLYFL